MSLNSNNFLSLQNGVANLTDLTSGQAGRGASSLNCSKCLYSVSLDRNDLLCLQNSIANGALGALGQTDGSAGSFNCGNSNGSVLQRSDVISSSDDLATNGANTAGSEAGLGASGLLSLCLFNLVSDLIGNYSLAAELFFAIGAVYDIVVRAGSGASSFNLVFYNDFASLVTQSGISNDALVGNVATIALSGLGAICSASSILVCNVLSEGVTKSRNFLLLNGELFADGALHTSGQTCLVAGGSSCSNKFCGVAGCFGGLCLTREFSIALGAVNNGVISAFNFALRSNFVFLNSLSGGVLELLGGLSLARNLFFANGAVNYGIVGAFLCASSSNFVFNYSLCGGVTLGAGSSGLNVGDLVTCGSEYFEILRIDHHRSLFTLEILSNGKVQSNDNVCILIFLCIGVSKYEYGCIAVVVIISYGKDSAQLAKGISLVVKGVTRQSQSGCIINNLKVDRAYTGVVCNFDININRITGGNFDVAFGISGVNRNAEGGSVVSCRNSNDSQRDHHYSNQKRY